MGIVKIGMFIGRADVPKAIFGIPIRFDARSPRIADARGLWPFKKIVVGAGWLCLPPTWAQAVLLHEAAHCLKFHLEKRIAALPLLFLRPAVSMRLCAEQEMEADAFAATYAHGAELLEFLTRCPGEASAFYPTSEERVTRLAALIRGKT